MNEKFWELNKSRQDNMISSAVKVFALNGFRHASTDEIVAEASVSKGLLFHYFQSKTGLYSFLVEYCARFALVELNSELRRKETLSFFELERARTRAEASSMRQYPYIILFLDKVRTDGTTGEQDMSSLELYEDRLRELAGSCILPSVMSEKDAGNITRLLSLVRKDTADSLLRNGNFTPERYTAAVDRTISFFEQFYKKN